MMLDGPLGNDGAGRVGAETRDLLRTWMSVLGTKDIDVLARRLSFDGASLDAASSYFAGLQRSASDPPGSWLEEALTDMPAIEATRPPALEPYPFSDLWAGVAEAAMRALPHRLPAKVAARYRTDLDRWGRFNGLRQDLRGSLIAKLAAVGEAALWAEFNERRTTDDLVLAHVRAEADGTGAFPRDIYCAFLDDLRRDRCRRLTAKYPVLARHIDTTVEQCLHYVGEMLTRVVEDEAALKQHFRLPHDAELVSILFDLSDPHRGGKTVARLAFRSDDGAGRIYHLAYKPKDLGLDHAYQRLIADCPALGLRGEPLRSVAVLTRGGYGYMEWVAHRPCADEAELDAFYGNAGRLAAILHLLGASDCHHENLIANGDALILIDAETLFEGVPDLAQHGDDHPSPTPLETRMASSVIRTGLLPRWSFIGRQRHRRDASALGVEAPQSPVRRIEGWVALNSDGMFADEVSVPATISTALPVAAGSRNPLGSFAGSFRQGFEAQLTAVAADKDRWLGDDGLIQRFRQCRRRFVPRQTWIYTWLRGELLNPAALSSEAAQRLVLEELARRYLVSKARPKDWPLFAEEVAQMAVLDIPFFDLRVESCDVDLPQGHRFEQAFSVSGYDSARRRIETLDAQEIAFQGQIVQGAIAAKYGHLHHAAHVHPERPNAPEHAISACERHDAVRSIGKLLIGSAITCDEGIVEWLGIDHAEDAERLQYGPLGPSLYGGRIGIALLLAALADRASPDADLCRRTALAACSDLLRHTTRGAPDELRRWWRDQPMGLAGSGGALLALRHMAELMPELRAGVEDGLPRILDALDADMLRADERFDIVLGSAGLIGPLMEIGTPRALDLAAIAGDHLVRHQDDGGGWLLPSVGPRALTGFSHGAGGIAAALTRLHAVTGDRRQHAAAARALRYERGTFDGSIGNWPDYRFPHDPAEPRFMLSWCHGAPGIALSRLCIEGTAVWDEAAGVELRAALEATASVGQADDSICCGRFGRAAILRWARERGWDVGSAGDAARLEDQALLDSRANGAFSFLDVLGLFNGLSGVGLALLDSVAAPQRRLLPSILSAGLLRANLERRLEERPPGLPAAA